MTNPRPLVVFALEMESCGLFDQYDVLHTGVGKTQAGYNLTKQIHKKRPGIVVNLGSAGSAVHKAGSVVACRQFIQRDMDVTPLGFERYATPFVDRPAMLEYGQTIPHYPQAVCGTGDNFETAHSGELYDVVDMEAYVLAHICEQEDIPFLCLKYISDGADGAAADNWEKALEDGARKLRAALDTSLNAGGS